MVTQSSSSAKGEKRMNDKRKNDNNVTIEHCARYTDGAEDFEDRDSWLSLKNPLWNALDFVDSRPPLFLILLGNVFGVVAPY